MTKNKKNLKTNLTHLDKNGRVKMVDVSAKPQTERIAKAEAFVFMNSQTVEKLKNNKIPKGNVLTTAKIAGIQAAKQTSALIPLCHPLNLSWVDIQFETQENGVRIEAIAKTTEATGVEMEALTAVSVTALTIYDMCKSLDSEMTISGIQLIEKSGGKTDTKLSFSPKTAVLVLSQSVSLGKAKDTSGKILTEGLRKYGCKISHTAVIPDDNKALQSVIQKLVKKKFDLIVTTGGTGVGPYDITPDAVLPLLTQRLSGVEHTLYNFGQKRTPTAMLSRLLAGKINNTFILCLPGNPEAVKDALSAVFPPFFHSFPIRSGEKH